MSTCARVLVEQLAGRGVDQVFGIPGNHTLALYRHLEASGIRHVTCRHEQGAAFMADGFARACGRPGVCFLVSGPGLLNAATAIAQARADSVPMLIITAVAGLGDLGMRRGTLHELPHQQATAVSLSSDSHTLFDPANLPELLDRAFARFQIGRPGPVHIEIPLDVMEAPLRIKTSATQRTLFAPGMSPAALAAVAQRLDRSRSPLLLVGGGAVDAGAAITELAQRLDAPVLNTVNGKGVCAREHALAVGGSPSLSCLRRALAEADCVLAIGTEVSETDYDLLMDGGIEVTSTWIRIDIDAAQLSSRSPAGIAVLADANTAAEQITQTIRARSSNGSQRAAALREEIAREPHFHEEMHAFLETLRGAAADVVLVGDSTRPTYYAAWQYECSAPRRYFHSASGFGTLGFALPAAFGARLATGAPTICLIGDGGAQFTLPELLTGADSELPVAVVIWNNGGYAEIETSLRSAGASVESARISAPDFASAARAHRCDYAQPGNLNDLHTALTRAFDNQRPTLIEVREQDFITRPAGQWYG